MFALKMYGGSQQHTCQIKNYIEPDWQSRILQDAIEFGKPDIDLFTSRINR